MKNGGLIFSIIIFSSFVVFGFLTAPALAQDAIQCTPGDVITAGYVKLNRNLIFTNPLLNNNNIYLGIGKLNFSSTDTGPYATNSGGNLLLLSPSSILLQSGGDFKFQNSSGNEFAQFFTGTTPSLKGTGNLLVNGDIEGLGSIQGNQVCVTGSGTQCVSSWSDVNVAGYGESRCDGVHNGALLPCLDVVATNNVTGKQLCLQGDCIDAWSDVMFNGSGGYITMLNNMLQIGKDASLVMAAGSTFRVCDDINGDKNYDSDNNPSNGDDFLDPGECRGSGRGVSKIIAGSGITITPASGDGDVTISAGGENWTLAGNDIYNNNVGNVGIGIAPGASYKLDVNGNIHLSKGARIFRLTTHNKAEASNNIVASGTFSQSGGNCKTQLSVVNYIFSITDPSAFRVKLENGYESHVSDSFRCRVKNNGIEIGWFGFDGTSDWPSNQSYDYPLPVGNNSISVDCQTKEDDFPPGIPDCTVNDYVECWNTGCYDPNVNSGDIKIGATITSWEQDDIVL